MQFWHGFTDHHDTIHDVTHVCKKGEHHLEAYHIHCAFITFEFDTFLNDHLFQFFAIENIVKSFIVYIGYSHQCYSLFTSCFESRGPPSLVNY
jgi:hypothetical protein